MTKDPKILLDKEAFLRRIQRQDKDKHWASDVRSYEFWKGHYAKYNSPIAKERMEALEAKYPGKLK